MSRDFNVIIERDSEGNYVASVPSLRGCHTQAKSLDELIERIREAIQLCLDVEGETPESIDFVGMQRVTVTL
jgi:predicted RNase H-like HicB family nuclease